MKIKIIIAVLTGLIMSTVPVQANTTDKTLVIMDTALNTKLPIFKNNLTQEVCILKWNSCRNNSNFMEGKGASFMPLNQMYLKGFSHGTKMTHAAILTNPKIKIIFIRIVGSTPGGSRQDTEEETFVNALKWVLDNKNKYNIGAVAMSQGHNGYLSGDNYCPNTPNSQQAISNLENAGVPVFLPAGNHGDIQRVFWPACLKDTTVVSATSESNIPTLYSNYDKNATDMFALGRLRVAGVNGILFSEEGTSISVQVAASIYVGLLNKYPQYSKEEVFNFMKENSVKIVNRNMDSYVVSSQLLLTHSS